MTNTPIKKLNTVQLDLSGIRKYQLASQSIEVSALENGNKVLTFFQTGMDSVLFELTPEQCDYVAALLLLRHPLTDEKGACEMKQQAIFMSELEAIKKAWVEQLAKKCTCPVEFSNLAIADILRMEEAQKHRVISDLESQNLLLLSPRPLVESNSGLTPVPDMSAELPRGLVSEDCDPSASSSVPQQE